MWALERVSQDETEKWKYETFRDEPPPEVKVQETPQALQEDADAFATSFAALQAGMLGR